MPPYATSPARPVVTMSLSHYGLPITVTLVTVVTSTFHLALRALS